MDLFYTTTMYGLLNKYTHKFDQFVKEDKLWLYIDPDYKPVKMDENQAEIIKHACNLKEWKTPTITTVFLIGGKINTSGRIFGEYTKVKMTDYNECVFRTSGEIVPEEYYQLVSESEETSSDDNYIKINKEIFTLLLHEIQPDFNICDGEYH